MSNKKIKSYSSFDPEMEKFKKRHLVVSKKGIVSGILAASLLVGAGTGTAIYFGLKTGNSSSESGNIVINPVSSDKANITDVRTDSIGNKLCTISSKTKDLITSIDVCIGSKKLSNNEYKYEPLNDASKFIVTIYAETLKKYSGNITVNPNFYQEPVEPIYEGPKVDQYGWVKALYRLYAGKLNLKGKYIGYSSNLDQLTNTSNIEDGTVTEDTYDYDVLNDGDNEKCLTKLKRVNIKTSETVSDIQKNFYTSPIPNSRMNNYTYKIDDLYTPESLAKIKSQGADKEYISKTQSGNVLFGLINDLVFSSSELNKYVPTEYNLYKFDESKGAYTYSYAVGSKDTEGQYLRVESEITFKDGKLIKIKYSVESGYVEYDYETLELVYRQSYYQCKTGDFEISNYDKVDKVELPKSEIIREINSDNIYTDTLANESVIKDCTYFNNFEEQPVSVSLKEKVYYFNPAYRRAVLDPRGGKYRLTTTIVGEVDEEDLKYLNVTSSNESVGKVEKVTDEEELEKGLYKFTTGKTFGTTTITYEYYDAKCTFDVVVSDGLQLTKDYSGNYILSGNYKALKDETGTLNIPGTYESYNIDRISLFNLLKYETISVGENIKTISDGCFADDTDLRNITLPSTLETIEESAFSACSLLDNVTLPEGLLEIGEYVFNGCATLSKIAIPSTVTSLGKYCFYNCAALESVDLSSNANISEMSRNLFHGCNKLTEIKFPTTPDLNLSQYLFNNCSSLESLVIPSNVKNACYWNNNGYYMFYGCSKLKNITFESNTVFNDGGQLRLEDCRIGDLSGFESGTTRTVKIKSHASNINTLIINKMTDLGFTNTTESGYLVFTKTAS